MEGVAALEMTDFSFRLPWQDKMNESSSDERPDSFEGKMIGSNSDLRT